MDSSLLTGTLQTHFNAFKILIMHLVARDFQHFLVDKKLNQQFSIRKMPPLQFVIFTSPNLIREASCFYLSKEWTSLTVCSVSLEYNVSYVFVTVQPV